MAATIKTRKFRSIQELDLFFAGGVFGAANIVGGDPIAGGSPGIYGLSGLVGKTLKFLQPSVTTVTFVLGADPGGRLLFKEIKLQIETAIPAVRVEQYESRLMLREVTPTSGTSIDKTGTANPILGFDAGNNTTGLLYAGVGGAAPSFQCAYSTNDNMHVVQTLE